MLNTRIEVEPGEYLTLNWGWWHLECILTINEEEDGELKSEGKHVVQREWEFVDPTDGEVLTIHPGYVLHMWRV